ncbi:MAG: hypothetical protein CMO55_11405 [Verrucomicrobiales bacterium]|nr:hypothetical protein [Verrucomicrobiales bacterium]
MGSLTYTIISYLVLFGVILFLPLLVFPKRSRSYIWIWGFYLLGTLTLILTKGWELSTRGPISPPDGTPMSPIGGASLGEFLYGFAFLISIPLLLYVLTFGLPWFFKGWPPHGKLRGKQRDPLSP